MFPILEGAPETIKKQLETRVCIVDLVGFAHTKRMRARLPSPRPFRIPHQFRLKVIPGDISALAAKCLGQLSLHIATGSNFFVPGMGQTMKRWNMPGTDLERVGKGWNKLGTGLEQAQRRWSSLGTGRLGTGAVDRVGTGLERVGTGWNVNRLGTGPRALGQI